MWTFADLLDRLGHAVAAVHNPDMARQLGALKLPDALPGPAPRELTSPRNDVLLAVGVAGTEAEALAQSAAEGGFAVVIIRGHVPPPSGCAVIELGPEVDWLWVIRQLDPQDPHHTTAPEHNAARGAIGGLDDGDLFGLADALADRVGGPVIIEDANFQVLSFSSFVGPTDKGRDQTILGRRMTQEWLAYLEQTGKLDTLRSTDEVVEVVGGPMEARRRLITAIRTDEQFLGILWVSEGASPLPDDAASLLQQSAVIARTHLERHYVSQDADRRDRGRVVRSLLDGDGLLHRHAEEIGLDRRAEYVVFAFGSSNPISTDRLLDRITDHVSLCCEAYRWQSAVCRIGSKVFAIVAVPQGASTAGVMRLGAEIVTRVIPALRTVLVGAASTADSGLAAIPPGRREAEDALGALLDIGPHNEPRFVAADDLRPHVILREILQMVTDRRDLELPGLAKLVLEDDLKGTDYVKTLRVFLAESGNLSAASRQLKIHSTTLRYRLTRIEELSKLDLDDRRVRLCCSLLLEGRATKPPRHFHE